MEDNEFDMDKFDQEAQRNAELFSIGKPLFAELKRLWSEGDQIAVEALLARLTSTQEEALRYISDLSNRNVDHFEQLLETGDREMITEFLLELPRIFKQPIRDVLSRHKSRSQACLLSCPFCSVTTACSLNKRHQARYYIRKVE
jgi:hypothetical protein